MSVRRKIFYPVAFSAMLFASSAMAKIPSTAFVGVTDYLKEKSYSPTWGEVFLESGAAQGILLDGPFEAAFNADKSRDYINDTSTISHWNALKILCPSNNGVFGTTFDAATNFSKYVKDTKPVALLLNYLYEVENVKGKGDLPGKVTEEFTKKIMESLNLQGVGQATQKNLKQNTISPLLKFIRESVKEEKKGASLFLSGTMKQILLTYFCYQFNTQDDIWELLENLNNSIVDKEKLKTSPPHTHYLEKDDLPKIAEKPVLDLDDLFDLTQAYIFSSPTPYKANVSLLNNGSATYYDRDHDSYIQGKTFSDCVETAERHMSNLLMFNPISREFDLTAIETFVREKERESGVRNPYFDNFKNFYSKQNFLMANAGDIGTRSLWNTVVGNLPKTTYRRENANEIRSGFINLLSTFDTLFSLSLKPAPTMGLDAKKAWVRESLQTLFTALNPSYSYTIDLTTSEVGQELLGSALITVRDTEKRADLFSFNISSKLNSYGSGHTEVNKLKILESQKDIIDYTKDIEKNLEIIKKGTAEESLLLSASPNLQTHIHPVYQLYAQPLFDNQTRINFLKKLSDNYGTWKFHPSFKSNFPMIQSIVRNVMGGICWEDPYAAAVISPIIKKMLKDPDLKTLVVSVKAINFKDWNLGDIEEASKSLQNLEYMHLNNNKSIVNLSIKGEFKDNFKNIKMLSFEDSSIQKIELESLSQLETMGFNRANNLEEVSFKDLIALKSLNFSNLGIQKVFIENAPALNNLSWVNAHSLQEVALKNLNNLMYLSCGELSVQKIDLDSLENLLGLYLADTKDLKEIFLKNLNKLNILTLSRSGIKNLEIDTLPGLEFLFGSHTKQLQELSFRGMCNQLTELDLEESGLSRLTGVHFLPNLKRLNLNNAQNIQELEFTTDQKDLTLSLTGSGIKSPQQIKGIEHLDESKIEWKLKSPRSGGISDNLWDTLY